MELEKSKHPHFYDNFFLTNHFIFDNWNTLSIVFQDHPERIKVQWKAMKLWLRGSLFSGSLTNANGIWLRMFFQIGLLKGLGHILSSVLDHKSRPKSKKKSKLKTHVHSKTPIPSSTGNSQAQSLGYTCTVTGQWLCSDCSQLQRWLSCQWQCSHRSAGSFQQSLASHSVVNAYSRWLME